MIIEDYMSKKKAQIAAAMAASKKFSGPTLVTTPGSKPAPLSDMAAPAIAGGKSKPGTIGSPHTKLPPLPRTKRSKKKTPKECECGCGEMTAGGRFVPGHDSKLKAWALRVERGLIKIRDIEHPGIRAAVTKLLKIGGTATMVAAPKGAPVTKAETAKTVAKIKAAPKPVKPSKVDDDAADEAELDALDEAEADLGDA